MFQMLQRDRSLHFTNEDNFGRANERSTCPRQLARFALRCDRNYPDYAARPLNRRVSDYSFTAPVKDET